MIDMSAEALHAKYESARSAEDILFYGYLYQEKKCFGLDYNDLIKFTLHIFERNPEIRSKWQSRLEYVMVDEVSRTSTACSTSSWRMLQGYHHNLFVVGDPDQTIYTWRGANVRYLLDFDKRFPGTRTIMMNDNYRSTPQVACGGKLAHRHQRAAHEEVPRGTTSRRRARALSSCGGLRPGGILDLRGG